MGFIPFSTEPIVYKDAETGVEYTLRAPTDEVEISLIEHKETFPDGTDRDKILTENERELRRWINGMIDIILIGWKSDTVKLPEFPKERPSESMPVPLKIAILNWWNKQKSFTGEEIKK